MRFSADCVPCLLSRVIYQTDLVDPGKRDTAVAEALKIINEGYPRGENSAKLASKVHKKAYEAVGSSDPYLDLKDRSNEAVTSVLPEAKAFIDSSSDRLEAACLVAIVGNVMDFGIKVGMDGPEEFGREFRALLEQGIQVNEVGRLRHLLERSRQVHYLLDNCGEVVLDRFLVEEIKAMGVRVIGVVKGEPILTDVTAKELVSTGMDKAFDSWTSTRTFAVGLDLGKVPELRREIESSDLVISKGMANFEYLSDESLPKVAYLLRTKCRPVAKAIGASLDQNVVRVIEHQHDARGC